MIFHENRLAILMKYHTFFRKLGKMSQNLSSAAVVIGALRVNSVVLVKHSTGIYSRDATGNVFQS